MKTFAVIGMGKFGFSVAKKLFELGHEVLAIDLDQNRIQAVSEYVTHAVACDAKEESALRAVGIRNYDTVIVAIGEDVTDSVLITLLVKELGIKNVICKAMDRNHKKILMKIGADRVLIPEQEMGAKLALSLNSNNMMEVLELSDVYGVAEVDVPHKWIGRSIKDLNVRKRYDVNIIAVQPDGKDDIEVSPDPDYAFAEGDRAVLVGRNEDINVIYNMN